MGDGVNDAPALAGADISISFKDASDISINTSDVIILNKNMKSIKYLYKISKISFLIIKINLIVSFLYNFILIIIASGVFKNVGLLLSPSISAIIMITSSLFVIVSSSILYIFKDRL